MKRIVICADGTWNKPEKDLKKDVPTNVLKLARGIKPVGADGVAQQVFYDWGIDSFVGGITGQGLHKNIMDNYRYIVQNYSPGDEIYFFGFSRGAYTVRCLSGLINNCGILKRPDAALIQKAFSYYKNSKRAYKPGGAKSVEFRERYSHDLIRIHFIGVWDTVGAMGIPFSFLGLFTKDDEFYDNRLGKNVNIARHAMAIDEERLDFKPTIWEVDRARDIEQVWFTGVHSDVGGGYKSDSNRTVLSDNSLKWMIDEAAKAGLTIESHLQNNVLLSAMAKKHNSMRIYFRVRGKHVRGIDHGKGRVLLHNSVKKRYNNDPKYRPVNLVKFLNQKGGWNNNFIV